VDFAGLAEVRLLVLTARISGNPYNLEKIAKGLLPKGIPLSSKSTHVMIKHVDFQMPLKLTLILKEHLNFF